MPQVEETEVIDLAASHSIFGSSDVHFGMKLGFTELTALAPVNEERDDLEDLFDGEAITVAVTCLLAFGQARSSQRWIARGITAYDIPRRECHDDLPTLYCFDEAEPEFWFGQTMPTLAGNEIHRRPTDGCTADPRPGSRGRGITLQPFAFSSLACS